jgi:hypothetical protein
MNLFRSEEHARAWKGFDPAMAKTLRPAAFWAELFSEQFFRERGRADYMTWLRSPEGRQSITRFQARLP